MAKISVIVPVYNVKNYLSACVESIVNQTFTDLEILLIDDGSTDGSGALCDEWAEKDRRIQVMHQKNSGVSAARNRGMNAAKGQYWMFVDSDDYIAEKMVETLYCQIKKHDADMALCGFVKVGKTERTLVCPESGIFSGQEILCEKKHGKNFGVWTIACNKLIRRDIFKSLSYPEGKYCEDEYMAFPMYMRCKKVVSVSDALYYYRFRDGSITTTPNLKFELDRWEVSILNANRYMDHELSSSEAFKLMVYGLEFMSRCPKRILSLEQRERYYQLLRQQNHLLDRLQKQQISKMKKVSCFLLKIAPAMVFQTGMKFRKILESKL